MTPPQQVAEPVDEPRAALIATCTCGRRIWRLALDSAGAALLSERFGLDEATARQYVDALRSSGLMAH